MGVTCSANHFQKDSQNGIHSVSCTPREDSCAPRKTSLHQAASGAMLSEPCETTSAVPPAATAVLKASSNNDNNIINNASSENGNHNSNVAPPPGAPPSNSTRSPRRTIVQISKPPLSSDQSAAPMHYPVPPPPPPQLSRRAQHIIQRVESIIQRCSAHGDNANSTNNKANGKHHHDKSSASTSVSEEDMAMYEIFMSLRHSPIGPLFVNHSEVTLSNRCCVITTAGFGPDETIAGFRLRGAFSPGTIGRSYLAVSETAEQRQCILKVIAFVLRKNLVDEVVTEQRVLVHTNYENVVKICDVLNDDYKENIVVVTPYHSHGNISRYAGKLHDDPDKLRYIIHEVGAGLRLIHSHHIFHHNMKLDNVLETDDGRFCIADAGFSRLFTSQCPEALVFNGELASLPPEVFDEKYPYADDSHEVEPTDSGPSSAANSTSTVPSRHAVATKVDVWGFGILMYRLAYGCEPFEISECSYEEVRQRITKREPVFPTNVTWSFAKDLQHVISMCLTKDPLKRPSVLELLRLPFFKEPNFMVSLVSPMPGSSFAIPRVMSSAHMGTSLRRIASMSVTNKGQQRNGYTVNSFLGRGRFSETLLVHLRRNASQLYAFKMITKSVLKRMQEEGDQNRAQRILKQLAMCRKMNHPNITRYIDIVDGKKSDCFVVQEYVKGGPLKTMPPLAAPPGKLQLSQLLSDVLRGLMYLHDNGVAHLFVTPSNILLSDDPGSSKRYKLVDYGPLFMTTEEIAEAESKGMPLFSLPPWILKEEPINGFHVDTFCVGLLAASILPKLFSIIWPQFTCEDGYAPISIEKIMGVVRESSKKLPPKLVQFIEVALTQKTDARTLLQHPYFENKFPLKDLPVTTVQVTTAEVTHAVQAKPEVRDENRMFELLGQDPFHESQMLSSVVEEGATTPDTKVILEFTGANMRCGQCNAEVPLVFYLCLICEGYTRCGKCAMTDSHKANHELHPYVVHTVEHSKNNSKATLFPISPLQDVHALEALEMSANLPSGALSKYAAAAHRSLDRSVARSCLMLSGPDLGSTTHIPDVENSLSMHPTRSSASLKMVSSTSNFNFSSPVPNGSTSKTTFPSAGKLGLFKKNKAIALPKAAEVDDISWQEELERCRETRNSELLLFDFKFEQVPSVVYSPPPLHVVFLDLSQNKLTSLPHELSFLVRLRKLVVSYNQLTVLPDSLGNLTELESIDASHNSLTDLPMTFIYLVNLQSVAMDYNDFEGIPESILDIMPQPSSTLDQTAATSVTTAHRSEFGESCTTEPEPALSVLYLAANDRITVLPDKEKLKRFPSLKIALDNEPSLYRKYMQDDLETALPNITISWNKIYPDEIIPNLYCGSLRSAQSQMVYRKLHITHLLTVGRGLVPVPPDNGEHKTIIVDDIPGADIMSSSKESIDFIDESIKRNEGCLVHCFAGLSRSATTVIAYLMVKKGMRLDEAYLATKKGRPAILPNRGFFDQLVRLDKQLFGGKVRALDIASLERPGE